MKIQLKKGPRAAFEEIEVEKGTTIEAIYKKIERELPYKILLAKVNYEYEGLDYEIRQECSVELLDMRVQAASLVYQSSLSLLYLKAIHDVLGAVDVDIENALNKGLYTEIKRDVPVTAKEVRQIQQRMEALVRADLPLMKEALSKEEAIAFFEKTGRTDKIALLAENPKTKKVRFYSLDGYRDFFYGRMVPSTGYLTRFELRKYRRGVLMRFPQPSDPNRIPDYVDERVLYQTFGEQSRWGKLMGIDYAFDLNRKIEEGKFKELIQLSEALHERRIVEIADMITKQKKRIILIAGPSSSGKTTFAQRLCIQLRISQQKNQNFFKKFFSPLIRRGRPAPPTAPGSAAGRGSGACGTGTRRSPAGRRSPRSSALPRKTRSKAPAPPPPSPAAAPPPAAPAAPAGPRRAPAPCRPGAASAAPRQSGPRSGSGIAASSSASPRG